MLGSRFRGGGRGTADSKPSYCQSPKGGSSDSSVFRFICHLQLGRVPRHHLYVLNKQLLLGIHWQVYVQSAFRAYPDLHIPPTFTFVLSGFQSALSNLCASMLKLHTVSSEQWVYAQIDTKLNTSSMRYQSSGHLQNNRLKSYLLMHIVVNWELNHCIACRIAQLGENKMSVLGRRYLYSLGSVTHNKYRLICGNSSFLLKRRAFPWFWKVTEQKKGKDIVF